MGRHDVKIAFLLRYGQMKERMLVLIERRKAYETDIYGIKSPVLDDMPKAHKKTDLSDKVVRLLTMTQDIDNEMDGLQEKMNYIKVSLQRLHNYRLLSVLEMKYIDGLQRKQIADIMNMAIPSVDKLIRKGIYTLSVTKEDLDKVL